MFLQHHHNIIDHSPARLRKHIITQSSDCPPNFLEFLQTESFCNVCIICVKMPLSVHTTQGAQLAWHSHRAWTHAPKHAIYEKTHIWHTSLINMEMQINTKRRLLLTRMSKSYGDTPGVLYGKWCRQSRSSHGWFMYTKEVPFFYFSLIAFVSQRARALFWAPSHARHTQAHMLIQAALQRNYTTNVLRICFVPRGVLLAQVPAASVNAR